MTAKHFTLLLLLFITISPARAQLRKADSAGVAKALQSLLAACKKINLPDPVATQAGRYYKAAPYIIYRGSDKKRAWKSFANYSLAEDKRTVDEVCNRINETINRDVAYKIVKYLTEKESEGTWHVLMVSYKENDVAKEAAFAFLKVNGRFGLGDID